MLVAGCDFNRCDLFAKYSHTHTYSYSYNFILLLMIISSHKEYLRSMFRALLFVILFVFSSVFLCIALTRSKNVLYSHENQSDHNCYSYDEIHTKQSTYISNTSQFIINRWSQQFYICK